MPYHHRRHVLEVGGCVEDTQILGVVDVCPAGSFRILLLLLFLLLLLLLEPEAGKQIQRKMLPQIYIYFKGDFLLGSESKKMSGELRNCRRGMRFA